MSSFDGAPNRNRTGTPGEGRQILSLLCLPISPSGPGAYFPLFSEPARATPCSPQAAFYSDFNDYQNKTYLIYQITIVIIFDDRPRHRA